MEKSSLVIWTSFTCWLFFMVGVSLASEASDLGISPSVEVSIDSGDYGGGDTINVYAVTLGLDYAYSDRLSFSVSWTPYIYQSESFTDVVLLGGRPIHHKDRYGYNPHQPGTSSHKTTEGEKNTTQQISTVESDNDGQYHDINHHNTESASHENHDGKIWC